MCRRAKFHFDNDVDMSDIMSSDSDYDELFANYEQAFKPAQERLINKMYFV